MNANFRFSSDRQGLLALRDFSSTLLSKEWLKDASILLESYKPLLAESLLNPF
jgi:hypothetical protein